MRRKKTVNTIVYIVAYEGGVYDETAKITRIQNDVRDLIGRGFKRIQVFAKGESLRVF